MKSFYVQSIVHHHSIFGLINNSTHSCIGHIEIHDLIPHQNYLISIEYRVRDSQFWSPVFKYSYMTSGLPPSQAEVELIPGGLNKFGDICRIYLTVTLLLHFYVL